MISPTGSNTVRSDTQGDGKYGARRHRRHHKGTDYVCMPGGFVYAPISGTITREAKPYANKHFSGCELVGVNMTIKMFYFDLHAAMIGSSVLQGDTIGVSQDISTDHGNDGMVPHIHLEITSINPDIFINQL